MMPFAALRLRKPVSGGGWASSWVDDFSTNTIASYSQTADTSATWSVVSSSMTVTGGLQSVLYPTGVSAANARIGVHMQDAVDAGLALRVNGNTHYLLAISNAAYAPAAQTLHIYRRISGTYTDLTGSVSITWPSATSKLVEFEAIGTSLKVYIDGGVVSSITDSSITAAGNAGMRHAGAVGSNSFQDLRIDY